MCTVLHGSKQKDKLDTACVPLDSMWICKKYKIPQFKVAPWTQLTIFCWRVSLQRHRRLVLSFSFLFSLHLCCYYCCHPVLNSAGCLKHQISVCFSSCLFRPSKSALIYSLFGLHSSVLLYSRGLVPTAPACDHFSAVFVHFPVSLLCSFHWCLATLELPCPCFLICPFLTTSTCRCKLQYTKCGLYTANVAVGEAYKC